MIRSTSSFHEPDDRDLERRVAAYLSDRHLPGLRRLQVIARRGVVTLRGQVQTFYEKQLGGRVAQRVAGVVGLVDDVKVAPAATFSNRRSLQRAAARGMGLHIADEHAADAALDRSAAALPLSREAQDSAPQIQQE